MVESFFSSHVRCLDTNAQGSGSVLTVEDHNMIWLTREERWFEPDAIIADFFHTLGYVGSLPVGGHSFVAPSFFQE